jgi:hypothetical protein
MTLEALLGPDFEEIGKSGRPDAGCRMPDAGCRSVCQDDGRLLPEGFGELVQEARRI